MNSNQSTNNRAQAPLPVYETWYISMPEIPPRSRLYNLRPQWPGTGWVESLTGYTARLAEEYCVRPATLVAKEIFPQSGLAYLAGQQRVEGTFWRKSVALNGTGEWASDWVRTLEALTMRTELRQLTMLTWANVLSPRGLLRRTRAWCPQCYQEWDDAGITVYDPLIWAFEVITMCPRHNRCSLATRCPHEGCRRTQPPLAAKTRPGFCARCERWLGQAATAAPQQPVVNLVQQWECRSVAELLASAYIITEDDSPPRERIAQRLSTYLDSLAHGDPRELARLCRVSSRSMRDMLAGEQVPQLGTLLHICRNLDTTPLIFLLGYDPRDPRPGEKPGEDDGGNDSGNDGDARPPTAGPSAPGQGRRRKGKTPRAFQAERVREALEAALRAEGEPLPLRAVARQIGYDPSHLHKHFPGLCKAVAARYKAHVREGRVKRIQKLHADVRQATIARHHQGVYPSYRRVKALLDKPRQMHEPEAVTAWHQTLLALGWSGPPDTERAA
jgi:hypothetical protein